MTPNKPKRPRFWHWRWWRVHRIRRLVLAGVVLFLAYTVPLHVVQAWRIWLIGLLQLGGWPAFFGFTILYNVILVPFPYDPFLLGVAWFDADKSPFFWWVVATLGMVIAAMTDVYLGARIGRKVRPWLMQQFGYKRAEKAVDDYGLWAVGLSAITPIPFSMVCWMTGIVGVKRPLLLLAVVAGTRALRNAMVLWLGGNIGFDVFI